MLSHVSASPAVSGGRSFPRALRRLWLAALSLGAVGGGGLARADADQPRGLPFIRTYALDEIGRVPRSLRLGFDEFGRVAVMYDGVYSVLNDSTWVSRMEPARVSKVRTGALRFAHGRHFYGARGSWGIAEPGVDGNLVTRPFVPADAPEWTRVNPFNNLLATPTGMFFSDFNGAVYWDVASGRNTFFELPRLAAVFALNRRVFASSQEQLVELFPATGETRVVTGTVLDGRLIAFAVPLDASRALLAMGDGQLLSFDGRDATPWLHESVPPIQGGITAMVPLVDGGVAIAVAGRGVSLFTADGALRWSLLVPEFHRVGSMATDEPGVLWAMGEDAVHKIFYRSPLTSFGQKQGLTMTWPQVACWNGDVVVSSNNTLYVTEPARPGLPARFKGLPLVPSMHVGSVAASGAHLLAGNPAGVFAIAPDGTTTRVLAIDNVAGLEFIGPDTCIVIGPREIAALRYEGGRWTECAPRIPGVGEAPIRLVKHRALWIEMGGERVARLTLAGGRLDLQRIPLPWTGEQWTNVGIMDGLIVLSGATGQRTYYDETRETLVEAPHLDRILNRSPYWLLRMKQDAAGVTWAAHDQGVVTFTPREGGQVMDATTYALRNDSYPMVAILPGDSIWVAASRSLYHVERTAAPESGSLRPVLTSLFDDHQGAELLNRIPASGAPAHFAYEGNSLSFRFFSGTYAWLFPPAYEYRLGPADPWTPMDPGLVLRFPKLRDGAYRLEVRQARPSPSPAEPFTFAFIINPPWYRTPASYAAYAAALLLALLGIARWINHRSLRRNAELQHLVHERTKELESAMDQLGEKSRNEATLAERSRLAGEIHDSMQQGLSGSLLHLDTTMNHPSITPEMHDRLTVVRNMLAYTREEVQQAVWNLGSPLLHNATLGDALRKLAGYISSGAMEIGVTAAADPADLPPATRHHLLRIAQEALTNAVKHAQAAHIRVTLETRDGGVVLTVADDGRGFEPAEASAVERHFGLRGLRSRARAIKADLRISSSPGAGTTVRVTVPAPSPPSS